MCSKPEILLEPFAQAGAQQMNVHVELGDHVTPLLLENQIAGQKGRAGHQPTHVHLHGVALSLAIDSLLIMTVNPGFGGQPFIYEVLPKIQQAAAWRRERNSNITSAWMAELISRLRENARRRERTHSSAAPRC